MFHVIIIIIIIITFFFVFSRYKGIWVKKINAEKASWCCD